MNLPGESTLRREFLRLQQENKNRSESQRQQQVLQQQLKDQEKYKKLLLAERQKRIEQQKEQRKRLEDVRATALLQCCVVPCLLLSDRRIFTITARAAFSDVRMRLFRSQWSQTSLSA